MFVNGNGVNWNFCCKIVRLVPVARANCLKILEDKMLLREKYKDLLFRVPAPTDYILEYVDTCMEYARRGPLSTRRRRQRRHRRLDI